jgi:hypothetical protein
MIGNGFWATGITVKYGYSGGGKYGWAAEVKFYDDGFCNDDVSAGKVSTQGELRTRYHVPDDDDTAALTAVIDAVKADAARLGIQLRGSVYMEQDGEDLPAERLPAGNWRALINAQSARLGWDPLYAEVSR